MSATSSDIGILAVEVYTPRTYIQQSQLEEHAGVAAGKYTIGLGQDGMAVTGDAEDINSICLTAVAGLLEKYEIDPASIGRLEVGTETLIDKSKSTKTVLMSLFEGNTDIEGATIVNACYGGTAALLNAVAWCSSCDCEQYAIVVAADIAAYARGPARPTGGCGAVALLIGRDAPLVVGPRATHAAHVWDFFKPDPSVEYPTVDGALSQQCYYQALEDVYGRLGRKMSAGGGSWTAETPDYWCFHAPYNKLVQKSFARMFFLDARQQAKAGFETTDEEKKQSDQQQGASPLQQWLDLPLEDTYNDRALDGALKKLSAAAFKQRLEDANAASKAVGNTYTASVFLGIASLIDRVGSRGELTPGKSVGVFSYGSGALATMYSLRIRNPTRPDHQRFSIPSIARALDLTNRLAQRELIHPSELDLALETRARMHKAGAPYSPCFPTTGRLFPGTFFLKCVDAQWRRTYERIPKDAPVVPSGTASLAPPQVQRLARLDCVSRPATGKLQVLQEASQRIACVITGTAVGLPGAGGVFAASRERLVQGEQCIGPITDESVNSMLEKNVVQTLRLPDGTTKREPVDSKEKCIQLAAQLGSFDLTESYGVPSSLAKTMDLAAQVAVAAGMEALKDAGLVSGKSNDPAEWKLPEKYRDTTGVVYASSFPAMDAAVGEVMKFLQSKTVSSTASSQLIDALKNRVSINNAGLSKEDEDAFVRLEALVKERNGSHTTPYYEFDRKFLFRVLVLGNAQLAQLAGCRGPNTQTNAACAGTTQAIAMAQDMLISGRAERVVVVAGDNASGSTLLPWLGSGFRALGAATTEPSVENAALPFDKRRSGLLLGAGGIGMVLETEQSQIGRQPHCKVKARLLATQYSNSAFHGAALDRNHIASELSRFFRDVELLHGITKVEIATHGVYFSHETCTHASDASSCSGNEIAALRTAFGSDELLSQLLILNTKGFTGHPMGVSFEDVAAVEVLLRQQVPAVPNYQVPDAYLGGETLNVCRASGPYACRYALRFAAGFGSQVAFALYATAE